MPRTLSTLCLTVALAAVALSSPAFAGHHEASEPPPQGEHGDHGNHQGHERAPEHPPAHAEDAKKPGHKGHHGHGDDHKGHQPAPPAEND